jgi:Holliday junction resolvase
MATTPEGKVKAKVKKILDAYGAYYFMPATGGYGKSGVPDIVCCANGYFIGIECKAGKGKTTALQDKNLDAITAAAGVAVVINEDNIDYVTALMKMANKESQHEN